MLTMLAVEGGRHRAGGDDEGLDDKCPEDKGQNQGHDDGFDRIPNPVGRGLSAVDGRFFSGCFGAGHVFRGPLKGFYSCTIDETDGGHRRPAGHLSAGLFWTEHPIPLLFISTFRSVPPLKGLENLYVTSYIG